MIPGHGPDLSSRGDFSKTHKQTRRMHSWIGLDLTEGVKLLRSETNSQILSNLHFCDPFTPIFDKHVSAGLGSRGKPSTCVYRAE